LDVKTKKSITVVMMGHGVNLEAGKFLTTSYKLKIYTAKT